MVNAVGCDSVATLVLSVNPIVSSTTNVAVCPAALPYNWNGNSYNAAGSYNVTLVNAVGCDSVATLNLTVKSTSASTTNVAVCPSALPYSWNGNSYNAAGTYNVTLVNAVGCDSVATLNLTVKAIPPTPLITSNSPICSGETLTFSISNMLSGATYKWNGPNSYLASSASPVIPNILTGHS